MPVTIGFRPLNPGQSGPGISISKGQYETSPSWHTQQERLQMRAVIIPPNVPGGDFSANDILTAARTLKTLTSATTPTAGGTLTINGVPLGRYDYTVKPTSQISAGYLQTDWFTNTQDTRSAWILVNGDLTINQGAVLIPPVRKLFTVVYVTGVFLISGVVSMTARGANHSGTGSSGGFTAPGNIRLGSGTFSSITNPFIPAAGGGGAGPRASTGQTSGTAGANGGTGGGGGGAWRNNAGIVGAGSAGTCFSGGSGSGTVFNSGPTGIGSQNAGINGGAGSAGAGDQISPGGSGNPGGTGFFFGTPQSNINGGDGTGGTLIIIAEGSVTGTGGIESTGVATGILGGVSGGSSGGGSITILYNLDGATYQTSAAGGNSGGGGAGGAGTVRKLAIGTN